MKKLLFLIAALAGLSSAAQQKAQSSLNHINGFNLNKAYAGKDSCIEVYGQQKNQWIGVKGAPVNTTLQAHMPIGSNLGLGVGFNQWKAGLLSNTDFALALAYHARISKNVKVGAALNMGYFRFAYNNENVLVFDADDIMNRNRQTAGGTFADLGLLLQASKFELGLAVPRIFTTNPNIKVGQQDLVMNLEQYINVHAAYNLPLSASMMLRPMAIYRSIPSQGEIVDMLAEIKFNQSIGLSAGYRTRNGVIAAISYAIGPFKIAYGYDAGMSNLNGISNGSHEFLLGYRFCKAKKEKTPEAPKVAEAPQPMIWNAEVTNAETGEKISGIQGEILDKTTLSIRPQSIDNGKTSYAITEGTEYTLSIENQNYEPYKQPISSKELNQKIQLQPKKLPLFGVVKDAQTGAGIGDVKVSFGEEQYNTNGEGKFETVLKNQKIGTPITRKVKFEKKGYVPLEADFNTTVKDFEPIDIMKYLDKQPNMQPLTAGVDLAKLIDLKPIYFAVNSSDINPESSTELDKIVKILNENSEMKIEVESHTDCRGNATANEKLSDRRAKASADYIKSKITNPERVSGKGYGASRPVEACDNCKTCPDETHNKNRRTEFKIVK